MILDTPILDRPFSKNRGVTPVMSDRSFWSDVVMSRPETVQPDIIYTLVDSSGNRFVDHLGNVLIAVT